MSGIDGDLSVISNNDVSPTGAGSRHAKNPSFLTKDFNLSRHERRKSAMDCDSVINTDNGGGVPSANDLISGAHYSTAQATLTVVDYQNE